MKSTRKNREHIKQFLLSFFDEPKEDKWEIEKEINDFILVRYFHGEPVNDFNVMIFTKESRENQKKARQLFEK